MGEKSSIEWTDATVNFWWGCTKVGPGCDFCYAETFDKRTGGAHWGLNAPRRKIASAVKLIHKLDDAHAKWAIDREIKKALSEALGLPVPTVGTRRRVFIQSMSDLFDTEVPLEWFSEAWERIEICNRIDVQIVTKRISVVEKRLAAIGRTTWPQHVGLMVTVCNQDEVDRDIPRLLSLKIKFNIPWVGLSIEPLLGPVDLTAIPVPDDAAGKYAGHGYKFSALQRQDDLKLFNAPSHIDWVICGGESGANARPMHPAWARSLRDQCAEAEVPFLFKQWGTWGPYKVEAGGNLSGEVRSGRVRIVHPSGRGDLEISEATGGHNTEPGSIYMIRSGKKQSGRLLQGHEHNGMPEKIAA